MSRLPGILAQIEAVAGHSVATRIALSAGGTEMKFSKSAKGQLARMVGVEAARAIVEALGSEKYTIPMAHLRGQRGRQAQAARMLQAGKSHNEVAKSCDVHERTSRRVKARLKAAEARGLPLFPEE